LWSPESNDFRSTVIDPLRDLARPVDAPANDRVNARRKIVATPNESLPKGELSSLGQTVIGPERGTDKRCLMP
jgi:hypothetical protein